MVVRIFWASALTARFLDRVYVFVICLCIFKLFLYLSICLEFSIHLTICLLIVYTPYTPQPLANLVLGLDPKANGFHMVPCYPL